AAWEQGPNWARRLCKWTRDFMEDQHHLPFTPDATWKTSLLEKPDLKEAISEHLQSIGKYVCAMDIIKFMARPNILTKYRLAKPVSLLTAQTWMHVLDYRWTKVPSGQYVNGHEHADVVDYRNNIFLPAMARLDQYTRDYIDGHTVLKE
ncbi:hypothetical protein C8Q72DRAFT_788807, partial [Fomitopsis betulina]